ncbi:MAG: hypothetical protein ACRCXZ_01610 [Patescibacteria group bacterium]
MLLKKVILILGIAVSTLSTFGIQKPAQAGVPNQGAITLLPCSGASNQVNQAVPSFANPTSTDPATFLIFSSCKPVGNGGVPNPLFYYYDSMDAAFAPPSGLKDVLNWSVNSPKPTSKICKLKANLGKPFVIEKNYITSGPNAGTHNVNVHLCKKLVPMKLPKGTPIITGVMIQTNVIRSSVWLAGQHSADAINWNQQSYGFNPLNVFDLNGVLMP